MDARAYEYLTPIPGGYLRSRSTRDCRLRSNSAIGHRVAAPVAITGGYVAGAVDMDPPTKNKRVRGRNRRNRRLA